jgi:hypothetical protein
MTPPIHPYVVLLPGVPTNRGPKHAVVHVDEWAAVSLGEKEDYLFRVECDDYHSAADERDRLNHRPEGMTAQTWEDESNEAASSPADLPPSVPADNATAPPSSDDSPAATADPVFASAPSAPRPRRKLSLARNRETEQS